MIKFHKLLKKIKKRSFLQIYNTIDIENPIYQMNKKGEEESDV